MAYLQEAGASGTVTVPAKRWVHSYAAASTAGGTITITQNGEAAQDPITIPAGGSFDFTFPASLNERPEKLGEGSTIVFAGTDTFVVVFA